MGKDLPGVVKWWGYAKHLDNYKFSYIGIYDGGVGCADKGLAGANGAVLKEKPTGE